MDILDKIAMISGIVLPLWNIPLVYRIIRRRSSQDISLSWAIGVWACLALMAPSAFRSEDLVWRIFNIVNITIFSFVVVIVFIYRKKGPGS